MPEGSQILGQMAFVVHACDEECVAHCCHGHGPSYGGQVSLAFCGARHFIFLDSFKVFKTS